MTSVRLRLGVAATAVFAAAGLAWAGQASGLNVTVNYTGPGDVDAAFRMP